MKLLPILVYYQKYGSVVLTGILKRCCNMVDGKLMSYFLADSTTQMLYTITAE
jgi:hypothetical protein